MEDIEEDEGFGSVELYTRVIELEGEALAINGKNMHMLGYFKLITDKLETWKYIVGNNMPLIMPPFLGSAMLGGNKPSHSTKYIWILILMLKCGLELEPSSRHPMYHNFLR